MLSETIISDETLRQDMPKKTWYWLIAPIVLLLDQLIKLIIVNWLPVGERVAVLPGIFWLSHVRNTGFSFGLFQGNNFLMIWLVIAILGFLIWAYDKFPSKAERLAYWLIIGGLAGNLIDRIFRGSVVDMFDLGWWPVFNIADSAICIAVALILIAEIINWRKRKN
jgi:signal peptidase II